jgi:hypothetical protein
MSLFSPGLDDIEHPRSRASADRTGTLAGQESQSSKAIPQGAHRGVFRPERRKESHRVPKSGPEPLYSLEWSGERHSRPRFEQFARFQRGRPSLNNKPSKINTGLHAQ